MNTTYRRHKFTESWSLETYEVRVKNYIKNYEVRVRIGFLAHLRSRATGTVTL